MVTCRQMIPNFKQAHECCNVLWEIISAHKFCMKEFSFVSRCKSGRLCVPQKEKSIFKVGP